VVVDASGKIHISPQLVPLCNVIHPPQSGI
jgi:hypothetical protein